MAEDKKETPKRYSERNRVLLQRTRVIDGYIQVTHHVKVTVGDFWGVSQGIVT